MNEERWETIRASIKDQFEIEYEGTEDMEDSPGQAEVLEFEGPMGFMRVEFVTKPKTIGRKVHGSTRIGGDSREEIIFSEDEFVSHIQIFVFNDDTDEWDEVKKDLFE
ncbi:MAG: hypothetical protein ABIG66_03095 [Candidatus Kerfeldbacteria bacterium]